MYKAYRVEVVYLGDRDVVDRSEFTDLDEAKNEVHEKRKHYYNTTMYEVLLFEIRQMEI